MRKLSVNSGHNRRMIIVWAAVASILLLVSVHVRGVYAAEVDTSDGKRIVTVHDRGDSIGVMTEAGTLREMFDEEGIAIDKNDLVEPGLDDKLVAKSYEVNIYRARPVIVRDGASIKKVLSAYQTPSQIVRHAGIELRDEDNTELRPITNMVGYGAGAEVVIDRATSLKLTLYGTTTTAYTQAQTVAELMREKGIKLGRHDTLSVKQSTPITEGMKVEVWRNGKQMITRKESIPFTVERIEDADRPVGYRQVKVAGKNGKKMVTYQAVMKNGKIIKKKVVQTVVVSKPKKQVEIVGTKPSFSGDFAAALAKLRSCEGGYDSWNPAGPYYGAYQFDRGTWSSVSSAPYGNATPAEQDAAARALYERRGWSPWPVCGASLPDSYR